MPATKRLKIPNEHPEMKAPYLGITSTGETVKREKCVGECGDCGAKDGDYHWANCDQESCPKCGMQLLMCDCGWDVYSKNKQVKK